MNLRSQFVRDHEAFLRDYRPRFQGVFVKVCRVLAPRWDDTATLASASVAFYDHYFLDPEEGAESAAAEALAPLVDGGVEVAAILAKCFAVMTAEFVGYSVKHGEVVNAVHALTEVMRDALTALGAAAEHHAHDENAVVRMMVQQEGNELDVEVVCNGVTIRETTVLHRAEPALGSLDLSLPEGHRLAVSEGESVTLNAPFLPRPLIGKAHSVDEGERILTVGDIAEAQFTPRPRDAVRVQPSHPIDVRLSMRESSWDGRLADLSVGGISVVTNEELDEGKGAWVHVRFDLPVPGRAEPQPIDARAEIAAVIPAGKQWRYGLRLMPNLHEEKVIGEYVNHLQTEVIRRIQPEIHRSLYDHETRRRPLSPFVTATIGVVVICTFVGLLYYAVQARRGNPVGIDRVAEMLSLQEECDDLTERYSRTGNPADLQKFDECRRRLTLARERTRWQR